MDTPAHYTWEYDLYTYNGTAQSNCYEALFQVWQDVPWIKGMLLWQWPAKPYSGGSGDRTHKLIDKPVEGAVTRWYTPGSKVTVSNASATFSIVTNNKDTDVTFTVEVYTTSGNITNASIYLDNVGGSSTPVKMTFTAGNTWEYTYTVPEDLPPGDKEIYMKGFDDNGATGWTVLSLIVITPPWLNTLTLYDGGDESGNTDFLLGWTYGTAGFSDVTDSPKWDAFCGKFTLTTVPSGMTHVRDPSWNGIDCSRAHRLELWVRGTKKLPADQGVKIYLFSTNVRFSASYDISLTPNLRKVDIDVAYLTNTANGADPGFTMDGIVGIVFANADITLPGTIVYFDNIVLTVPMVLYDAIADPSTIANTNASESVTFTCIAISPMGNISSVTLDLSSIGLSRIQMSDISGGTNFSHTEIIDATGLTTGTYILPVIAWDTNGNSTTGGIFLSVAGLEPVILEIIYDGETPQTDANWESWWMTATSTEFIDQTTEVLYGSQSGKFEILSNGNNGGAHVPEPWWWSGVDVSKADKLEFFYKGDAVDLALFSYDPVDGTRYSTVLSLPAVPIATRVATNLSYFTNGQINFKKLVGVEIFSDFPTVTYFDDMWLTVMALVYDEQAVPDLIVNDQPNTVQFLIKANTYNLQITNAYIDLSSLGGPANAVMTNIDAGWTNFRFAFTVASNQTPGIYYLPVTAYDEKGYSGEGAIKLVIAGKTAYATFIVYDGDTVKADPIQWYPTNVPPMTGSFGDVDSTATPPHGDNYCGRFFQTNNVTTIYHRRSSDWSGFDVSSADELVIWYKGEAGGEQIELRFAFLDELGTLYKAVTNLTAIQSWVQALINIEDLTNGLGLPDLKRFVGVEIVGNAKNDTFYLDDVAFLQYVKIENEDSTPGTIDGDFDTDVVFTCDVFAALNNLTSVTIDLTPIGGSRFEMTNTVGSNYRYTFTVLSNYGLGTNAGAKKLLVTAYDAQGHAASKEIALKVISRRMILLYDFEDGNAQGFISCTPLQDCGGESQNGFSPNPECENMDNQHNATNWNTDEYAAHGNWSIG